MLDKPVRGWSHIILEGICTRHISREKDKYNYRIKDTEEIPWKFEKVKNPYYDPKYKVPKKPKYCKSRICYDCFDNDCPYLGISKPPDDEYKDIMMKIDEMYEDD